MGEAIRIGDDIEVVVSAVDKNKVKLGINSPRHIPIYREELYRKIQQENQAASGLGEEDMKHILESFLSGWINSAHDDEEPNPTSGAEE
ncbi:MAG: hypothetical protein AUK55_00660 [Syntrophobacteraceae bacterium CG2_30_61_12]|nr:MAG: hypothetical protein AUK55_00660 [Syntrophobacteraceae bacterium CG2_30_61_12]